MSKTAQEYLARKHAERQKTLDTVATIWFMCGSIVILYTLMLFC